MSTSSVWSTSITCALVALTAAADADDTAKSKDAKKAEPVVVNPKQIKWGDAPADLPAGGKMAVLFGDPSKNAPFAVRLKMPDGYKIAPHWHTNDEQLTVLAGTLVLRMGDTVKSPQHELERDAFHFLPGKMHHSAQAKGETVVQINGTGPFDIHYLDPADKPNPKSAKK